MTQHFRSGESRWSAVCGEGWTSQWSDLVCELLGAASSVSTEVRRVVESVPRPRVKLSQKASPGADKPLQYVLKSDCSVDSLVHLSCDQHCEFPKTVVGFCIFLINVASSALTFFHPCLCPDFEALSFSGKNFSFCFITFLLCVNVSVCLTACGSWSLGDDMLEEHQLSANEWPPAKEGQWPSLALLLRTHPNKNDTHAQGQYCSATIVAPSWVLAAYSCLSSK